MLGAHSVTEPYALRPVYVKVWIAQVSIYNLRDKQEYIA